MRSNLVADELYLVKELTVSDRVPSPPAMPVLISPIPASDAINLATQA